MSSARDDFQHLETDGPCGVQTPDHGDFPLYLELVPAPDPLDAFRRFRRLPGCVFLDSAAAHTRLGRFSYVAASPFFVCRGPHRPEEQASVSQLDELAVALTQLDSSPVAELPRFQGGAAGLLAYELGQTLESLPRAEHDDLQLPSLCMGFYDVVLAYDHQQQRAWLISQGWPEKSRDKRLERAHARLTQFHQLLAAETDSLREPNPHSLTALRRPTEQMPLSGPRFRVPGHTDLTSNFTEDRYRRMVGRAIEYIRDGDIFQVNLAQQLVQPASLSSAELYERLRKRNPAPFAGYFDLGEAQIVSASPERFVQVSGTQVETRPIKGTRRRTEQAEADLFRRSDLIESEKDRAENVMIVDLMRNDLSRVCLPDSVCVEQLCAVEEYQFVQHLVSAVTGTLRPDRTSVDLIKAAFPGGSVTGAPKIRAMEIIAELEPHVRGPYCGSLGYISWDGSLDLSILIRTITSVRGWWHLPVGGGIVAQSDPEAEWHETWHKARGLVS